MDRIYCRTEPGSPVWHVEPPLPVPYAEATTSGYEDGDPIRYIPPSYTGPSAHHDQSECLHPSSNATHSDSNWLFYTGAQRFVVPGGAYLSHPTTTGSRPVDTTTQATSTAVQEAGPSAHAGPSVPDLYCKTGYEEIANVSAGSPPLGTSTVRPRQPKARKQTGAAQREKRKIKCTRHSKTQRANMEQELIQVSISKFRPMQCIYDMGSHLFKITPLFLYTRLDLRVARQFRYRCVNPQGPWTQLPSIDFSVNRIEGIRLTDAMNLYFDGPDNRDDLMFTSESVKNTVSCRIHVGGPWSAGLDFCSSV